MTNVANSKVQFRFLKLLTDCTHVDVTAASLWSLPANFLNGNFDGSRPGLFTVRNAAEIQVIVTAPDQSKKTKTLAVVDTSVVKSFDILSAGISTWFCRGICGSILNMSWKAAPGATLYELRLYDISVKAANCADQAVYSYQTAATAIVALKINGLKSETPYAACVVAYDNAARSNARSSYNEPFPVNNK